MYLVFFHLSSSFLYYNSMMIEEVLVLHVHIQDLAVFIPQLWLCVATFYSLFLLFCKSAQLLNTTSNQLNLQSLPVQASHASHSMSTPTTKVTT